MLNFKNSLKIVITILIVGCTNHETAFYELSKMRFEIGADETTNGEIAEYFVVTNPPTNIDILAKTIQEYNDKTVDICNINDKNLSFYKRYFYKETYNFTRNYEEDHSYSSDLIVDHLNNLIAALTYQDNNDKWIYKLKTKNDPDIWKEYPFTFNCDKDREELITLFIKETSFDFNNIDKEEVHITIDSYKNEVLLVRVFLNTDGTGTLGWVEINFKKETVSDISLDPEIPLNLFYKKEAFNHLKSIFNSQ